MLGQEPPPKKVLTPSMVAQDYFKKDLALHQESSSHVIVIVHDSCYGHRFSRPRTSKAALNSIVERPERIHATLLGASMAYVRLGGRHEYGRHAPHPDRPAPSESFPFQIRRTARFLALNHASVTHVHGSKWMEELQIMCDSADAKLAINGKELVRPIGYGKDEEGGPLPKLHEGDLYLCAESLSALQGCLGGVCDAIDTVYSSSSTRRAFVCIRPPGHHCSSNIPSGFCWLNNVHVGISYAAMTHGLTHAAIIDFDLHHGDGSQSITWDHNRKAQSTPKNAAPYRKTPIGYYSIHDINSFPCEAGDPEKIRNASVCLENAHGQSIWNVHFEHWKDHNEFWKLYKTRYSVLLEKARMFLKHHSDRLRQSGVQPRAAVFISAGFDASEWEMSGMQRHGVNVPTEFYAKITSDIVKMSQEVDLGVDGRLISVLEGGYSDRALTSGVLSHLCGLTDEPSMNVSIDQRGGLSASATLSSFNGGPQNVSERTIDRYDPLWWDRDELEIIEAIVLGNMPPPPKASKEKPAGNYSSPTQASHNRMNEVAKERRSLSAQLEARLSLENDAPPPPPPVDWSIAAYELSRLLIPSDRQTQSCRHEELNAEATRVKKERQSVVSAPGAESMQLRDRRPKPPPIPPSHVQSSSRSSTRRTTIASVSDLPDPNLENTNGESVATGRPRRRSSASSSVVSGFQDMKMEDGDKARTTNRQEIKPISRPSAVITKSTKAPAVKKPRAPVASRAPAKTKSSPRKGTTSRPGSSSSGTIASRVPSDPLSQQGRPGPPSRQQSASAGNADDMDAITNGMKKVSIKLKMPPAEEQATKQRQGEQAKTSTAAKAAKKAPAGRAAKPKPVSRTNTSTTVQAKNIAEAAGTPEATNSVNPAPPAVVHRAPIPSSVATADISMSGDQGPTLPTAIHPPVSNPVSAAHPKDEYRAAADAQSAALPAFDIASNDKENTVPGPINNTVESVPIKPEQTSIEHNLVPPPAQPQNGNNAFVRPLTPNKKTKDDLPKFTSSSPIPFAKASSRPASSGGQESQLKGEGAVNGGSIWDIPETPQAAQQR